MFKPAPFLVFVVVLMIVSSACYISGVPITPEPNIVNTAVAQTLAAFQFQATQPVVLSNGTGTATTTFTPLPPTVSPTITFSPTPIFTSTPTVPQISVSVPTNCRVGPGKVYDRVGGLMVGEVAEVVGRNLEGNYWYIRNPDASGSYCWLWGEYAILAGNLQALPIFTPPPTPTPVPTFEVSYFGLEFCVDWWLDVKLENTGGVNFRSISMSVLDTNTNTTLSLSDNNFKNLDGCNTSNSMKTLASGEKFIVSSPAFSYDPTGHKMRATVTLCSEEGINGHCVTKVIEFKP